MSFKGHERSGRKCRLSPKHGSFAGVMAKRAARPECHKKRKPGELFARIFSRIALCLAVMMLVLVLFFDQLVCLAITTIGSRIIGAPISMDDIRISLTRGDISITNLRIGDPESSGEQTMVEVASCYLLLDKNSVFDGPVIIRNLEVRQVRIYGGITADSRFNLWDFADRLRQTAGEDSGNNSLIIENFLLEKFQLTIADERQENNISGFGIFIENLSGSPAQGEYQLTSLKLNPPNGFGRNLLELDQAEIFFAPGSFTRLQSLNTSGLRAVFYLREDRRFCLPMLCASFRELFPASGMQPDSGDAAAFENFSLQDNSFILRDAEENSGINGLGIHLDDIRGNWKNGLLEFLGLLITSPGGYEQNMLQMQSASLSFEPESLFTGTPVIKDIKVSNLNIVACIRSREHSNIGITAAAWKKLFLPPDSAAGSTSTQAWVENFDFINTSITITDSRPQHQGNINGMRIAFKRMNGSWRNGNLALDSLSISNPEGYSDHLLQIKNLLLEFDPDSLSRETTVIRDIQMDSALATACIKADGNSNFGDVKTAIELLFYPLFFSSSKTAAEKDEDAPPVLQIADARLTNCRFTIRDARETGSVDGMNFYLREMVYSQSQNICQITDLRAGNPPGYTKPYCLTLSSMSASLPDQTPGSSDQIIRQLLIDGMHGFAEFDSKGVLNAHLITDALCIIFIVKIPCQRESGSGPQTAAADGKTIIRNYQLKNSSFMLWDARTRIPIQIPLQQRETDYTIDRDGGNMFESIHDHTVSLGDTFSTVSNPQQLLMYLLNETAGSGVELLLKTGDSGIQIFRDVFNSLL